MQNDFFLVFLLVHDRAEKMEITFTRGKPNVGKKGGRTENAENGSARRLWGRLKPLDPGP